MLSEGLFEIFVIFIIWSAFSFSLASIIFLLSIKNPRNSIFWVSFRIDLVLCRANPNLCTMLIVGFMFPIRFCLLVYRYIEVNHKHNRLMTFQKQCLKFLKILSSHLHLHWACLQICKIF